MADLFSVLMILLDHPDVKFRIVTDGAVHAFNVQPGALNGVRQMVAFAPVLDHAAPDEGRDFAGKGEALALSVGFTGQPGQAVDKRLFLGDGEGLESHLDRVGIGPDHRNIPAGRFAERVPFHIRRVQGINIGKKFGCADSQGIDRPDANIHIVMLGPFIQALNNQITIRAAKGIINVDLWGGFGQLKAPLLKLYAIRLHPVNTISINQMGNNFGHQYPLWVK